MVLGKYACTNSHPYPKASTQILLKQTAALLDGPNVEGNTDGTINAVA